MGNWQALDTRHQATGNRLAATVAHFWAPKATVLNASFKTQ